MLSAAPSVRFTSKNRSNGAGSLGKGLAVSASRKRLAGSHSETRFLREVQSKPRKHLEASGEAGSRPLLATSAPKGRLASTSSLTTLVAQRTLSASSAFCWALGSLSAAALL